MLIIKIQTFIKSLFFHIMLGLPKSTQQEIDTRYNICNQCEDYNIKNQECNQCGCFISKKKIFLNKLAWADQRCPINKWGPIIRK
jgi:hypothetical protein